MTPPPLGKPGLFNPRSQREVRSRPHGTSTLSCGMGSRCAQLCVQRPDSSGDTGTPPAGLPPVVLSACEARLQGSPSGLAGTSVTRLEGQPCSQGPGLRDQGSSRPAGKGHPAGLGAAGPVPGLWRVERRWGDWYRPGEEVLGGWAMLGPALSQWLQQGWVWGCGEGLILACPLHSLTHLPAAGVQAAEGHLSWSAGAPQWLYWGELGRGLPPTIS